MKLYRKSSRTYSNNEISYEIICNLINKAINYAPSSCNHQMWHFIAVDNKRLKKDIFKISSQEHFKEASWIIFITTQYGWNHNKFSVIQSAAAATQMILFFADQEGLVGCWNAGIGNTNKIKELLNIDNGFGVIGALTIGYPGAKSKFEIKASKRKVNNVLSRNIFNRPQMSIYPLRNKKEPIFWKAMNNSNIYAEHNPRKWTFAQISDFRSYSVFAKSPFPNTYFSKRYNQEFKKELFGNKIIESNLDKNEHCKILEILPYGGQYTNLIALRGNYNLKIAEYSESNFNYIQSRLTAQNLRKIDFLKINEKGEIINSREKFDIIYCIQSIEEYPKEEILISEIKKLCKKETYIVFSIRNLLSWYGIQFYLKTRRNQVPNFGPHIPLNSFGILNKIKKQYDLVETYGVSPTPRMPGKKINSPILKYFCRLLVIVCKVKDI